MAASVSQLVCQLVCEPVRFRKPLASRRIGADGGLGAWRQKKGLSDTLLNSANEPLTSGDRDGVAALALTCRALRDAAHLRSLKRHVSGLRLLLLQLALLR